MTQLYPNSINEKGIAHVAAELLALGLEWDATATCEAIEATNSFAEADEVGGCAYEISNHHLPRPNNGYPAFIYLSGEMIDWIEGDDDSPHDDDELAFCGVPELDR